MIAKILQPAVQMIAVIIPVQKNQSHWQYRFVLEW